METQSCNIPSIFPYQIRVVKKLVANKLITKIVYKNYKIYNFIRIGCQGYTHVGRQFLVQSKQHILVTSDEKWAATALCFGLKRRAIFVNHELVSGYNRIVILCVMRVLFSSCSKRRRFLGSLSLASLHKTMFNTQPLQ